MFIKPVKAPERSVNQNLTYFFSSFGIGAGRANIKFCFRQVSFFVSLFDF